MAALTSSVVISKSPAFPLSYDFDERYVFRFLIGLTHAHSVVKTAVPLIRITAINTRSRRSHHGICSRDIWDNSTNTASVSTATMWRFGIPATPSTPTTTRPSFGKPVEFVASLNGVIGAVAVGAKLT
ncbi:RING/U-box superfamily protein [Striga asiatica]|uniref:RING/U-box superfamily protein n=1 Tax=Striga asiatica TaxID=4170 RepID=A0A5A7QJ58_STRAF|nr:RING/U-box superfamily protein [Striga asiatica]